MRGVLECILGCGSKGRCFRGVDARSREDDEEVVHCKVQY